MSAEIEIKPSRILDAIRKMLDDISGLPLEGKEFEDVKSNTNLARAIIDKTDSNSSLAIINRFYNYYTSNKKAFLERNQAILQAELPLTKKISILIGPIIEKTGGKSSEMWQHLTLIFYLISLSKKQPDQKLKQLLEKKLEEKESPVKDSDDEEDEDEEEEEDEKKSPPEQEKVADVMPSSAAAGAVADTSNGFTPVSNRKKNLRRMRRSKLGGEEEDVINQVVQTVSSGINGPIDDPMTAITSLMASGGLQKIMNTIQTSIRSGRVKPKKMLATVHGMLDNLSSQLGEDEDKE
jgi:hypothetical protein